MTEVVEYRMTVLLFGATSSPACSTFSVRTLASNQSDKTSGKYSKQAMEFIKEDFCVDDGLLSLYSQEQTVGIVKSAIDMR